MHHLRRPAQRRTAQTLLAVGVLIIVAVIARFLPESRPAAAAFDYYLLALSWSPSYCESHPDEREQCGRRGFGFVVHGLWPQLEQGGGPKDCADSAGPDQATIERTLAFMPSTRLIEHEWRSHGTCTGLEPKAYFELTDRAYAAVKMPPQLIAPTTRPRMSAEDVRQAFVQANPGLRPDMLAVTCNSATLSEVRVCLDGDLKPRSCGKGVKMQCAHDGELRIPLAR